MKEPHPWKMIGHYEDGEEVIVGGSDAEDCPRKLLELVIPYTQKAISASSCLRRIGG